MSRLSQQISNLTPEQLSLLKSKITTRQAEKVRKIARREDSDSYPLSLAQESLWLVNQLEPGAHYNDYTAFRITGSLDVAALEKAIGEVVRRHEVLRATFQEKAGVPVQQITPYSGFKLNRIGLRGKPEPAVDVRRIRVDHVERHLPHRVGHPNKYRRRAAADVGIDRV